MAGAVKMWVAVHPDDPDNYEVRFSEPNRDGEYLGSCREGIDDIYVEWEEYVCIPVSEGFSV